MSPSSPVLQRLQALRQAMHEQGLHAYVAVSSDPHLSEYLPEHWQGRQWLSGFAGSAGTLVVTAVGAALWTDSRYWEQAGNDLTGTGIELMKAGAPNVPSPQQWVSQHLGKGSRVNIDGMVLSVQSHRQWLEALSAAGIELDCGTDVLSAVWANRPALPQGTVYEHLAPFACRTRADNLTQVRMAMIEHKAQWLWLSSLDDIAWLFNLRGTDVSYNPVFLAHALVGLNDARLFVAPDKVPPEVVQRLAHDAVQLCAYDQAGSALAALPAGDTLLFDPARTTAGVIQAADKVNTTEALNPSQLLKSCKNAQEIDHVRGTMQADGAALCEFFAWFEAALERGESVTELTIDEKITAARARQPHFVCPSFGTIAAFGPNGAMPHYHATAESHAVIRGDGLLLIDSGGQYLGGTTDITRVVPVGRVSPEQKADYTAVLRGMIALSQAVFPKGVASPVLDVIARGPVWQASADYGHGTGHGVGYFMNVHEGPQSIAYRASINANMAMQPGMITSNEPGLYRPGRWGIRIENLVLAVEHTTTEFGEFLAFETLTLCPIDTRCIATERLAAGEIEWLDTYHAQVRERLLPLVQGDAKAWLLARTEPISKL
jgi:Xaa-Pro aminopeptidase